MISTSAKPMLTRSAVTLPVSTWAFFSASDSPESVACTSIPVSCMNGLK